MTPENELLRSYARTGSEEAFSELVRRHVNLVYSAALRQVGGDTHLAQDVAQTVFTELARKAASLSGCNSLTGWLYTNAYFAANKVARTEHRRRQREEQFMREPIQDPTTAADWEKLRSALDSVMHELKETDRAAVLLRYFENRPFAEVGARLSVNENTARMRVERALEKLRGLLAKRGITTGAALASVISANAVQTAPASLSGSLATAALSGAGTGALTFFQTMNTLKLKLGFGTLATAGVIGVLVMQLHAQRALRAENESLSGQIGQLKADNEKLSNQIAANDNALASQKDQADELLKLRAEVTRLRSMHIAPKVATAPAVHSLQIAKEGQITVKARFVSIPAESAPLFEAGWTTTDADTSLLSDEQFGVVISALQAKKPAALLNEVQVTTISGRQCQAQITDTVPIEGENLPIGEILDMVPSYSSDSPIFNLKLIATLNQLTGDASQAGVMETQISNQVSVFPGQTVALKADVPPGGWLPGVTNLPEGPWKLLVFVTPTLIDEAGNKLQAYTNNPAWHKMMDAKQGVTALIMFAKDNGKQYPANIDQAGTYMGNDNMKMVESNFDFVNPGSVTNVPQLATTILLKEKEPWQGTDGNWRKIYGFADSHVEVHMEPSGNFNDFEKEHTLAASGQ